MKKKELHIFKEDTDAIATNRGFYYQHLKTVKLWLNNYIENRNINIYCEWEDDISEYNKISRKYNFHQVKSYSKKASLNDDFIVSSLLNFLKLNNEHDVEEFYFECNAEFRPYKGKSLKELAENQNNKDFTIPIEIIDEIKNNLLAYNKKRLNKTIANQKDKTKKKELEVEISKKLEEFEKILEKDFRSFLKKIKWNFSESKSPEADVQNLENDIELILKNSNKLNYDKTVNLDYLFRTIYYEVAKRSTEKNKEHRILNKKSLQEIFDLVKIETILDFYSDKDLLIELKKIFESFSAKSDEIEKAENFIKNGKLDKALEVYDRIREENKNHNDIGLLDYKRAKLNYELGNYAIVLDISKKYEFLTGFTILQAVSLGKLKQYDRALSHFNSINENEQNDIVLYNIAVSNMFLKNNDRAIEYFQLAINKNNKSENSYLNLAICLYTKNPLDKQVLTNLDKALNLNSDFEEALSQKGEVLRFLGKYSKAKNCFKKALALNQNNLVSLYGLAMCLFQNEKYSEGMIYFNNWVYSFFSEMIIDEKIIVDIGFKDTINVTIKNEKNELIVFINNHKFILQSNMSKDFVFIGLFDEIPIVGKSYFKYTDFIKTKNEIQKILNYQEDVIPTYFLELIDSEKKVEILLKEDDNRVFINIIIDNMKIQGFTKKGNTDGFYEFSDNYQNQNQGEKVCSIILRNSENKEQFIIDTIDRCVIED